MRAVVTAAMPERESGRTLKSNSEDSNVLAALGHLYATSGDTDNAQGILNKLLLPGSEYVSPVAIATIHMGLYHHAATASEKTKQEAALKHYLTWGAKTTPATCCFSV